MKKLLFTSLLACSGMIAFAQEKMPSWLNYAKLSGYGMVQYQAVDQNGASSNSFNLRMARFSVDGRILNDFYWKAQIQVNGNTSTLGSSPRIVDLFAEWQHFDCFKVKFGQFKRAFSFENPMHPLDQGFMSYSQNITKLAGFSDRNGAHASNGRDIGLQFQGDFLKINDARYLLHYQIGVYNGQGINAKDVDNRKDIIGGMWIMPIKGMRIGAFGWTGSYARKGTWKEIDSSNGDHPDNTIEKKGARSLKQDRYAFSAEYKGHDMTFRTEYIHSSGLAFKKAHQSTADASNAEIDYSLGDRADGVYALAIVPIIGNKLYAKARYDMYRPTGDWSKAKTLYEIGLNYLFNKNLRIHSEYARVNDRSLADEHNYNLVDMQLDFRF